MKQITITIPDNCELKQEGNNYTVVEKEKKLTYEDIAKSLFSKPAFFIGTTGCITANNSLGKYATDLNNCTSQKQGDKLLAINKLMNVAKYLNGDWQPNWNRLKEKYYFIYDDSVLKIQSVSSIQCLDIYFKSEEHAKQAIEILGEETIRLALSSDY